MLWVAFSRRMCCSRVWSASTKPRRPSASVRLARDPARHPAQVLLGGGEEAERRAAEVEPVAERLALPDRDVDAALARRAQDAERDRVDRGDRERARDPWRAAASASRSSTAPRKFGFWTKTAAVSSSTASRELVGVGQPAGEADLDHLGAEPRA